MAMRGAGIMGSFLIKQETVGTQSCEYFLTAVLCQVVQYSMDAKLLVL